MEAAIDRAEGADGRVARARLRLDEWVVSSENMPRHSVLDEPLEENETSEVPDPIAVEEVLEDVAPDDGEKVVLEDAPSKKKGVR